MIMDNFKETTLKGHIQLCELRYKSLEDKLEAMNDRIDSLESKVSDLGRTINGNFTEIKLQLEKTNSRRDVQVIATLGTIIVATIGAVAIYIK